MWWSFSSLLNSREECNTLYFRWTFSVVITSQGYYEMHGSGQDVHRKWARHSCHSYSIFLLSCLSRRSQLVLCLTHTLLVSMISTTKFRLRKEQMQVLVYVITEARNEERTGKLHWIKRKMQFWLNWEKWTILPKLRGGESLVNDLPSFRGKLVEYKDIWGKCLLRVVLFTSGSPFSIMNC